MGTNTKIPYADHTLNFWRGCTKVSPGCNFCYMYRDNKRFGLDPTKLVKTGRQIWKQLFRKKTVGQAADGKFPGVEIGQIIWRPYDIVMVCSWSDFFHKDADGKLRDMAFDVMNRRMDLRWIIPTKRPERIIECMRKSEAAFGPNTIILATTENQAMLELRTKQIRDAQQVCGNFHAGLSCEPLLEPLDFKGGELLKDIGWVVTGCESKGPPERLCYQAAISRVVIDCNAARVPCFVKQIPVNRVCNDRPDEWPVSLRVQKHFWKRG